MAEPQAPSARTPPALTLITAVVIVGVLYFARDILVPLALAVLLSFALGPLVALLRRAHLGRVLSVAAAVLLAFLVITGIGSLVGTQLGQLADNLPRYQYTVMDKVHALQDATAGLFGRLPKVLEDLGGTIAQPPPEPQAQPETAPPGEQKPKKPIPVEIHEPPPTTLQIIRTIVGPMLDPLATAGIVIIFVVFFLVQRENLRDRFIRLVGAGDLQKTTQGLDDGARRVSRYLLAQLALNTGFGIVIGTGLWLIGVPNPVLWGILAMLLRFVPYIGPLLAALCPAALALAVAPGWSTVLWTIALFLAVEPILGQVVEPLLYGRSTGLSAVAVVVAAAFWTWLWGPIGLLLSTPLTLCLVVIGRHVERLEFLDIILGDQPGLSPEENFYQRMLAGDPDEAADQAELYLKEHSLVAYYDAVALPGLSLAQLDVNRGRLDKSRREEIRDAVMELIDDLADHAGDARERTAAAEEAQTREQERAEAQGRWQEMAAQSAPALARAEARATAAPPEPPLTPGRRGGTVFCIGGRGPLDEAAAAMLCQLLEGRGLATRTVPVSDVTAMNIARLDTAGAAAICLSYVEPGGLTNARYLVRRLRRRLPGVPILVGFWTLSPDSPKAARGRAPDRRRPRRRLAAPGARRDRGRGTAGRPPEANGARRRARRARPRACRVGPIDRHPLSLGRGKGPARSAARVRDAFAVIPTARRSDWRTIPPA